MSSVRELVHPVYGVARSLLAAIERRITNARRHTGRTAPQLLAQAAGGSSEKSDSVSALRGTQIIRRMEADHHHLAMRATALQVTVQHGILAGALPLIYGHETWAAQRDAICEYWNVRLDRVRTKVALSCPRRFGKSEGVAMMVALLLRHAVGLQMLVVSTGQRTAQLFAEIVKKHFESLPRLDECQYGASASRIWCSPDGSPKNARSNSVFCVPNNPATVRGVTAQLVLFDEGAFGNPAMYTEVVLPLLSVTHTVFAVMSSPAASGDAIFTQLFSMKRENGENMFMGVLVRTVCEQCGTEKKTECIHSANQRPSWQSGAAVEDVRLMYKAIDASGRTYAREVGGANASNEVHGIEKEWIENFRAAPRYSYARAPAPPELFVAVDTSAGGDNETGVVVASVNEDKRIVIHAALAWTMKNAVPQEEIRRTVDAVYGVAQMPPFRQSTIVVMVEADHSPSVAQGFYHAMRHRSGVCFMYENKANPKCPGVIKGRKGDMYQQVIAALMKNDRLRWGSDFYTPPGEREEACMETMYTQMGRYKRAFRHRRDARFDETPYSVWTAKSQDGGNDDMLTALLTLTYWTSEFLAKRKYQKARNGRGPSSLPFAGECLRDNGLLPREAIEAEDRDAAEEQRRLVREAAAAAMLSKKRARGDRGDEEEETDEEEEEGPAPKHPNPLWDF